MIPWLVCRRAPGYGPQSAHEPDMLESVDPFAQDAGIGLHGAELLLQPLLFVMGDRGEYRVPVDELVQFLDLVIEVGFFVHYTLLMWLHVNLHSNRPIACRVVRLSALSKCCHCCASYVPCQPH